MRSISLAALACSAATLLLSGCVPPPPPAVPEATGGSRSGGLVQMSVRHAPLQPIDYARADDDATRRCLSWGYVGALRYPGVRTSCVQPGLMGACVVQETQISYECTGVGTQVQN